MSNHQIEKTVAKGAGKLAGIEARIKGLRGVFATLAEQHREAMSLLERVHSTTDAEKRQALWVEVRRALLSHERAELLEVYPALETHPSTRAIVTRHAAEAGQLEATIKQLDGQTMATEGWRQTLERLMSLVKSHAAEEEGDFFVRAQGVLEPEVTTELEERFTRAQAIELTEIG